MISRFIAAGVFVLGFISLSALGQGMTTAQITPTVIDVGPVVLGGTAEAMVTITNTGNADLQLEVTYPNDDQFRALDCQGGGQLVSTTVLAPGASCVHALVIGTGLAIPPGLYGPGTAVFTYNVNTPDSPMRVAVSWNSIPFPLSITPSSLAFPPQQVGLTAPCQQVGPSSLCQQVVITNLSPYYGWPLQIDVVAGSAPDCDGRIPLPGSLCLNELDQERRSFLLTTNGCDPLPAGGTCTASVSFVPQAAFNLNAALEIRIKTLFTTQPQVALSGQGIPVQTTPGTVLAVEYFDAALGHYFLTTLPSEINFLDTGGFPGWVRTGRSFWVWPADGSAPSDTNPVCRFYGRPEAGLNSHFYSASPAECLAVLSRFPEAWIIETWDLFNVLLPDTATGNCPLGTTPVYRLYNNRADANHRYTTDLNLRSQMMALGWIPEGYGTIGVVMCSPE